MGVLIVMRPGAAAVSSYALLVLLSTLAIAGVALLIKHLSEWESATTIVFYQSLFLTLLSLPPALLVWRSPSGGAFALLVAVGALGTVSWMCYTRAFALADASAVMPYEFLKLPITLLAYLLFAEVPTLWTWLGGAVIFGSTIYIAQREASVARNRVAAAAAATKAITPPASPHP